MSTQLCLVMLVLAALLMCAAVSGQPAGFKLHGKFLGIGGCLKQLVGPGPEPGSERLYASHIYGGDTLDIVATDPLTGKTDAFSSPVPSECGAWAMALSADGQVYVGTLPAAHILRLDWQQKKLVDMGRPSQTEQYIWQLALGSDKKLYGCTFPNAKLVRFDPATGQGEDLGRMSETENYARQVAADNNGFVYVGIGTSKQDLVAYEIATGQHRSILPPEETGKPGTVTVVRGADGAVYTPLGGWKKLNGWQLEPSQEPLTPPLALADGRRVTYDGRTVGVMNADGKTETHSTGYQGKSQSIFRIGLGPDGRLYGSTAMPIHFFWADPNTQDWAEIAEAGGGEFYSFLAWKDRLLGAAYSAPTPVISYQPGKPWAPGNTPADNPWRITYATANSGWRPMAMIAGPLDKVYIGAVSGYGLLGGPLCVFDPDAGTIDEYMNVVQDQSVVSLAALPNGLIVGGTTIGGGGGSHSTQTEAKLFLWDPQTREKLYEMVPVPGQGSVGALAVGKDGLVYGFSGETMFVFDPGQRKVIKTIPHGLGGVIYNAVGPGPQGKLYGLASTGIFTIDEAAQKPEIVAAYPGIEGGFAIRGQDIYFTVGPQIISYHLAE